MFSCTNDVHVSMQLDYLFAEPTPIRELTVHVRKTFQGHLFSFSWEIFGVADSFIVKICNLTVHCLENTTLTTTNTTDSYFTYKLLIMPPVPALEYEVTVVARENEYEGAAGALSITIGMGLNIADLETVEKL